MDKEKPVFPIIPTQAGTGERCAVLLVALQFRGVRDCRGGRGGFLGKSEALARKAV